jgi:mRNA-degrading endonuclease RelE of RelBE toxin-antitoxin system
LRCKKQWYEQVITKARQQRWAALQQFEENATAQSYHYKRATGDARRKHKAERESYRIFLQRNDTAASEAFVKAEAEFDKDLQALTRARRKQTGRRGGLVAQEKVRAGDSKVAEGTEGLEEQD